MWVRCTDISVSERTDLVVDDVYGTLLLVGDGAGLWFCCNRATVGQLGNFVQFVRLVSDTLVLEASCHSFLTIILSRSIFVGWFTGSGDDGCGDQESWRIGSVKAWMMVQLQIIIKRSLDLNPYGETACAPEII